MDVVEDHHGAGAHQVADQLYGSPLDLLGARGHAVGRRLDAQVAGGGAEHDGQRRAQVAQGIGQLGPAGDGTPDRLLQHGEGTAAAR